MRILDVGAGARVVFLGHGQLGSATAAAVASGGFDVRDDQRSVTDWSTPDRAAGSVAAALGRLRATDLPLTVVWAAGRCGMSSSEADCEASLASMRAVVRVIAPLRPRAVHLFGSVGAVALGTSRWSPPDVTGGRVPYARLKQAEEELVGMGDLGQPVVHRVASVYGPPGRPGRQGLVTALVVNASRLTPTRIYGRWSTLRNYVHADDVGAFVANKLIDGAGAGVHVLAASRSHTIAELVASVSGARGRQVPIRLVPADNADNLTVDPGAIAPGFRRRPLETAIAQMVLDLRHVPVV